MDLRTRLANLDRLTRKPRPEPPADVRAVPAGDALDVVVTGDLWWREDRVPALPAPSAPLPDVGGLLPAGSPADLAADEILFLDTETTGLAGGTGCLPFVIGLGWWDDDGLVTRQVFLPGPGCEAPMLADLAAVAARFRIVATYNGGSFDLPLLRTRALLARRADPLAHLVGWDLLTAVRRLWGRRLPDCRQPSAEHGVCRLAREGEDIDGALIPATYFQYLQTGAVGLLPAVLAHNRHDLRGMASLLVEILAAARSLTPAPLPRESWPGAWQDAWARGRVCERRRLPVEAAAWIRRAFDDAGVGVLAPAHAGVPLAFVLDAVRILKRTADWERVEVLLAAGLAACPGEARLHREAAMLYEHRLGDPGRALAHAETLGEARRLARLRSRLAG